MKRLFFTILATNLFFLSSAQDETQESLGQIIDKLTYSWDQEAEDLNNYESLRKFCHSAEYREQITSLLKDIHHYDSVLYDRLTKAARFNKDKEIEKALHEIENFETNYSMKSFLHFLHEECVRIKDIEHHSKELKNDIGAESYDGQVYIIETELHSYIKHITKSVDHIRKHVHHLHLK